MPLIVVLLIVRFLEVPIAVRISFGHFLLLLPCKLGFVVLFVVDLFEDWETGLWSHTALALQEIDHDAV